MLRIYILPIKFNFHIVHTVVKMLYLTAIQVCTVRLLLKHLIKLKLKRSLIIFSKDKWQNMFAVSYYEGHSQVYLIKTRVTNLPCTVKLLSSQWTGSKLTCCVMCNLFSKWNYIEVVLKCHLVLIDHTCELLTTAKIYLGLKQYLLKWRFSKKN